MMSDILSSIGNAITLAKRLKEISDNIKDAELKNVLADLSLELADTKLKLAEIITENADLKSKVLEYKDKKVLQNLQFKDGLYYLNGDKHPFCPNCYDKNKDAIRLQINSSRNMSERRLGSYKCGICKNYYK